MSMTVNNSVYNNYTVHDAEMKKKENSRQTRETESKKWGSEVEQPKLSQAAQKLLERLRNTYGNMDFMAADFKNAKEARDLLSRGTKEFSVLFSSEELEKMASDEKYEKECMARIEGALRMSDEINEKFGFDVASGKNSSNTGITRIGISFNSDGTTSYFAELEKSSASQREHMEKVREEKHARKKEEAKKAEGEKQKERLEGKAGHDVKRTLIQADSMEELIEKIRKVDWNAVRTGNEPETGRKFDFSI